MSVEKCGVCGYVGELSYCDVCEYFHCDDGDCSEKCYEEDSGSEEEVKDVRVFKFEDVFKFEYEGSDEDSDNAIYYEEDEEDKEDL